MKEAWRLRAQVFLSVVILGGSWIFFVADLKGHDLMVGVLATILATGFAFLAIRRLPIRFRPSFKDLVQCWRLPWYALSCTAEILWILILDLFGKRAGSHFRSAPYYANAESGEDVAKRALATGYTTVAPNFIIVGIDKTTGQMLFHQLKPSSVPKMTQRLGAKPE